MHPHKHRIRAVFRSVTLVALVGGYCTYNHVHYGTFHSGGGGEGGRGLPSVSTTTEERSRRHRHEPGIRSSTQRRTTVAAHGRTDMFSPLTDGAVFSASADPTPRHLSEKRRQDEDNGRRGLDGSFSARPTGRDLDEANQETARSPDRSSLQSERRTELAKCDDIKKADPTWTIALYVLGVLYMFLALAIVCDEFFVPALEEMSSDRHLNLSMDVAGATLMAAGGSAPELFTSLFGTFTESAVGFGTIVGSAVFNVLFVIGMCSLLSKEVLTLTWWPLFRDSSYYAVGLITLAMFVGVSSEEVIELWEAIVLLVMYLGYVIIMYFNRKIYRRLTGKELVLGGEEEERAAAPESNGPPSDDWNTEVERAPGSFRPTSSARSIISTHSNVEAVDFRWPGTFRAGVLKLLRDPDSWLETAGVGIVAKMAGDVDHVFREVDINGDGEIDKEELRTLFGKLDCHVSESELDDVMKELDQNNDGKISEQEFTAWYIRSEERILSRVKTTFDAFDVDHSGTIDRGEVKVLLEKLEPRVTDADVDEAIEAMYQDGSRDEITFEEFSDWYIHSMIFERQKKHVEEEMEGVCESLYPPRGKGCIAWTQWIVLLPLVAALTLTVPDVRRPGLHKWCYFSFILSICWIGLYSFFMVDWTERIGNTIGIPSVVMGLTFLAAGTSVPDLLSSVIVARRGEGDMAVSSSIGSNIFDILVGLPLPWIIYTAWPTKPDVVEVGSDNIWYFILILLGMLVFIIVAIHFQGWKLTKTLGGLMFLFYIAFLVIAIVLELPFKTCVD